MKYVEILQASLTPLIAVIAVLVAWLQYKNTRYKTKLDLYEKRYRVYQAIKEVRDVAISETSVKREEMLELISKTKEVEFLFGKEVNEYIKTLHLNLIKLNMSTTKLDRAIERSEDVKNYSEENAKLLHWLTDQPPVINKLFKKYLSFENLK